MLPEYLCKSLQKSLFLLRKHGKIVGKEGDISYIKKKGQYLSFFRSKSTYEEKTVFPKVSISEIQKDYQNLMKCLVQPVVIITTNDLKTNGMGRAITVSSFSSISINPMPIVSFSIKLPSRMAYLLGKSKRFAVHVLKSHCDQIKLAQEYAQNRVFNENEISNISKNHCKESLNELPILSGVLGILYCNTYKTINIGDHKIWFGTVEYVENIDVYEKMSLSYCQGDFRLIKKD
ncbi:hypothetical protein T552_02072 [Pneumocystis carinii B80]|uniref:Flavin reductase like domain-containing protein n=1 Tax=Pneumocystis carinii (strain B80) TaxID=1408658 RepID=A0A0W4ZGY2_PNEC8|nr:hypothetical protein T552_02072 [Pneumocystis carinii B80]KTW27630.1 hypothetical protein T552_02072 [Pneumocystis carinii B80]